MITSSRPSRSPSTTSIRRSRSAGPQTVDEGSQLSITESRHHHRSRLPQPANRWRTDETFTYAINWGDGTNPDTGAATIDDVGGVLDLTDASFDGSHTYADNGTYTVTVRVADDDMSGNFTSGVLGIDYVQQTFTVTVNNVNPTLTGTSDRVLNEGDIFTLTSLGVRLSDPGFDNPANVNDPTNGGEVAETFEVVKINWGDGIIDDNSDVDLSDPVSIVNRVSGNVGTPTTAMFSHDAHAYADNDTYTVTITVRDDDGEFVDLQFMIRVDNVRPIVPQPTNQTVAESEDLVLPVLATFSDPGFENSLNPNGPSTESFQYYVDWGDGRDQLATVPVADLNGSQGTPSTGTFGGAHNYADNGTYTVTVRVADDDMDAFDSAAIFQTGTADEDFVEVTFTVTVTNVAPSFTPQPNGENLAAPDLDQNGVTTILVGFNDPGYDNPLNTLASNGGEKVETFNHVVQWGDGTVDAIHQYTTSGTFNVTITMTPNGGDAVTVPVAGISSLNPVVNLVGSQQLNDPSVVPQLVTYTVDWGDGHVETFQLSLLNPGLPAGVNGLTTLVGSTRASGNATTLTTGSAAVQHTYLGPPDPLHPTADITITLTVYDDDGGNVTDFIAVGNPGITGDAVAIDTTPDVPRLDLTDAADDRRVRLRSRRPRTVVPDPRRPRRRRRSRGHHRTLPRAPHRLPRRHRERRLQDQGRGARRPAGVLQDAPRRPVPHLSRPHRKPLRAAGDRSRRPPRPRDRRLGRLGRHPRPAADRRGSAARRAAGSESEFGACSGRGGTRRLGDKETRRNRREWRRRMASWPPCLPRSLSPCLRRL